MFIEPLKGMNDTIKGLPGYQHPARQKNQFVNSKLDYFSELVIYLSLLIYSNNSQLWNEFYETEDLLFSKEDFLDPYNSKLIKKLLRSSNSQIADLSGKMIEELKATDIEQLHPLDELLVDKLEKAKETIFDKWNNQPNPPERKEVVKPNKNDITDKF